MHSLFSSPSNTPFRLQGLARVEEPILPRQDGLVFFDGTYWSARFYDPACQFTVFPGEKVHVIDRDRLTLLVMPIDAAPSQSQNKASHQRPSKARWMQMLGGVFSALLGIGTGGY